MKAFLIKYSRDIQKQVEEGFESSADQYPFKKMDEGVTFEEIDSHLAGKGSVRKDPTKLNYLEDIGLELEITNLGMTKEECLAQQSRRPHEHRIISIPRGKEEFIDHFRKVLRDKKTKRKLLEEDHLEPCYTIDDHRDGGSPNIDGNLDMEHDNANMAPEI